MCRCLAVCLSVLERLQSFLPQMAEANEKLRQQMEGAPAGLFDIESVEEDQRVIEMVSVALLVNVNSSAPLWSTRKLQIRELLVVVLSLLCD